MPWGGYGLRLLCWRAEMKAQVDGLVTLLTEIRKWMDKDMGAWDVKFMAEIDKALQQFSATEI